MAARVGRICGAGLLKSGNGVSFIQVGGFVGCGTGFGIFLSDERVEVDPQHLNALRNSLTYNVLNYIQWNATAKDKRRDYVIVGRYSCSDAPFL